MQPKLSGKEFFSVALWGFFIIFIFGLPALGTASNVDDLRDRIRQRNEEIANIEREIAAYQKTLDSTSERSKSIQNEIARLNAQIKKLNADITLTEKQISTTELEIEELGSEIETKESRIEESRKAMAGLIKLMYESDEDTLIEVLVKNNKVSDFFNDMQRSQEISASIKAHLISLLDLKAGLESEQNEQRKKRDTLAVLSSTLSDRKSIEEGGKQERQVLLNATKSQEALFQKLLKEKEQQRKQTLDEIQKIEEELRKLINPASLPSARPGVLASPIKGHVMLTQSFGSTPDSKILYGGKPHNGIDFKASVGTPIYAAESGIVRGVGDTDAFRGCLSYGKWILVEHPNNLSTLYAHLSLIKVSKGDTVKREDLIGYSGATGYATGPHLHFTVYDSKTVDFRSSSVPGSGCKYLPFGGYLNPLAYL